MRIMSFFIMNSAILYCFCLMFIIIIPKSNSMPSAHGSGIVKRNKISSEHFEPSGVPVRNSPIPRLFKRYRRGIKAFDKKSNDRAETIKQRGFYENSGERVSVKEKEEIGDFGFFVDNKAYATDQSTINEVNQQTFQQLSENIRDSEYKELLFDAELNQVSQKSEPTLANRNGEPPRPSRIFLMPLEQSIEKLSKKIPSNRQSNSDQTMNSGGISFDSDFSIGDHGYASDLSKVATGSGSILSPLYTVDNQGHNYEKNSDVNANIIVLVITSST
ncbi:uncharacterized protein LOC141849753 [Brevipalpus obovatus]|uniref:uncharacterized protein LOC141849753 n=1 Tax=Brevipalpus obovatus TaxID=246614 RepID=UPI003D9F16AA